MTEPPDDLLLVQLVSFQLHASDRLHGAVVMEALLPCQLRLHRRPLLQTVQVAFLLTDSEEDGTYQNIYFMSPHQRYLYLEIQLDVEFNCRMKRFTFSFLVCHLVSRLY